MRLANQNEAEACYQSIEDARAYHKSLGFEQWHPDYPTQQTILEDIAQNIGYAFVKGTEVIGYCCIIFGDEPAYKGIDGSWKTEKPYAVVHRMAFSSKSRGSGLSHEAFQLIKGFKVFFKNHFFNSNKAIHQRCKSRADNGCVVILGAAAIYINP